MTSTLLAKPMIPAALQTASFTAVGGRIYPINATSADVVATLPVGARQGTTITATRADASGHNATVAAGGSDTISSGTGTVASLPLTAQGQSVTVVADGAGHWAIAQLTGVGGGAVSSVAGRTGVVTLAKADVGLGNVDNTADASKPVSTAQAAADALALAKAANLSDLANAGTARTNLGLGTAATQASGAFDAAGAATAAQAASVQRANHTGSQLASTISDFSTAVGAVAASPLTPTAVKTANYTAAAGDFVPCDTTSAGFTLTLPNAPPDKTRVAVKHVIQGGTNAVAVACSGSDVFNKTGGATSFSLLLLAQSAIMQYKASTAIWYVQSDDLPLSQLDGRYVQQVNAAILDTTAADIQPTVATGTPVAGATGKASDSGHQHQIGGHTHADTNNGGTLGLSALSATGTRSSSTFLRGDNTFATPAGGSSLPVSDEGSQITAAATALNFVGSGVTATQASGAVTVTVPGGGSTFDPRKYTAPAGTVRVTHDRTAAAGGSAALTSGTLYLVAMPSAAGDVISALNVRTGTSGLVTVTHSWAGIFDASRVLLAVSADSIADVAASTKKTWTMGSAYTVPSDGLYYAGVMVAGATVTILSSSALGVQQVTEPPITQGTSNGSQTTPMAVSTTATALTPLAAAPIIWAT